MKKYLVIPLLFIYLMTMSGIVIHTHYCGSRLMSWSIGTKGDGCGDCEKSSKCKKCCKDKEISYKGSHEQNTVSAFKVTGAVADFTIANKLPDVSNFISKCFCSYQGSVYGPKAPPGVWQQIPLYKLYSSFAYYG